MQAATQTVKSVKTKLLHPVLDALGIGFIVASLLAPPAAAQDAPPGLVRRVEERESATARMRSDYAYRQVVTVEDFDRRGLRAGEYKEIRDVIFSPTGERTERLIGKPVSALDHIRLTPEDFRDIREVQPMLLTTESAFFYETRFQGEEDVDGIRCYVLRIKPRQILDGERLFDGLIWIEPDQFSIVRSEGRAVPEIRTMKSDNLFPAFRTTRMKVDGYWFPSITYGDDMLAFRTGPQRIRLTIRYSNYQRFSSNSTIVFDKK
jgi:hypothetical protein